MQTLAKPGYDYQRQGYNEGSTRLGSILGMECAAR